MRVDMGCSRKGGFTKREFTKRRVPVKGVNPLSTGLALSLYRVGLASLYSIPSACDHSVKCCFDMTEIKATDNQRWANHGRRIWL